MSCDHAHPTPQGSCSEHTCYDAGWREETRTSIAAAGRGRVSPTMSPFSPAGVQSLSTAVPSGESWGGSTGLAGAARWWSACGGTGGEEESGGGTAETPHTVS